MLMLLYTDGRKSTRQTQISSKKTNLSVLHMKWHNLSYAWTENDKNKKKSEIRLSQRCINRARISMTDIFG